MKKFTPSKLLLLIATLFVTSLTTRAQMLEQIDMSLIPGTYNTYVTGLNNSGYVTGYYNNGTSNIGFIITNQGTILKVLPSYVSATDTKVESINDNGVAVITANNGATVSIYKAYVDTVGDSIAGYVPVTGISQPSSVAFDINNNNDISGWFQSSTRFLWVKHDSIVPTGNIAFESNRVEIGIDQYNTMAGGVNDANKIAGFYIDGTLIKPFVYDNLTENFTYLNSAFKIRLWDINNNGWVAGEYLQTTNNVYMGFIANANTGSLTQFTSMNSIFANNGIQSVANAINDNGAVAGSFLHPTTGKWTGFLYFPEVSEYRIPDFDFEEDTWKMENTDQAPNPVWTNGYWQGTDYLTTDPYANNGEPLLDANIMATHQLTTLAANLNPKWKTFATEFDGTQSGLSSVPDEQDYYLTIIKPQIFDKWHGFATVGFTGDCYGFTYTALLRHFYDNLFSSWYGMPANTNISQVPNTDYAAVDALERMLCKQFDHTNKALTSQNILLWSALYRLKNTYRKGFNESDPRGISIKTGTSNVWHSVLPYKIRTARVLPFTAADTLFLYDSNYPDSTRLISFENDEMHPSTLMVYSNSYNITNFDFREVGIRSMENEQFSELKSTSSVTYRPLTSFGLFRHSDYHVSQNGNMVADFSAGVYDHDSLVVTPMRRPSADQPAYEHLIDSSATVDITTTNYTDNAMVWTQRNSSRSMGLSRAAQLTETDNSSQKTAMITYGNPDGATKYLTAFMRESATDMQQGVNITAKNICADQGDSIVTKSPSTFVYNITKVNGTSSCTYDLDIYAAYNGAINEFHSPVPIGPNTSHTIDPYFVGLNGVQIAVIVDNGNDGITDDTLFIAGFPLGMKNIIDKEGIKIYPNPVHDELNVEFTMAGKYSIIITDVVGKTISNNTMSVSAGRAVLPMGQYPAGMYLIQVMDEKGKSLLKDKIIKQ